MSVDAKIALVTGANKGIGFETAKQLAESGVKVILTSRDPAKGNEAFQKLKGKGLDVSFFKLDVTASDDIVKIKEYVEKSFGKLDILVNNAGMIQGEDWGANSVETVSIADLRTTFDVNFFGLVELTQTLLPLIKKSDAGRIVNLSSIMGSLELHSKPNSPIYDSKPFAYDASKTALNQFTVHLAHALKGTNIKVNSAHPGWVKTELGTDYAPMNVVDGAKTGVDLALAGNDSPTGGYVHLGKTLPW